MILCNLDYRIKLSTFSFSQVRQFAEPSSSSPNDAPSVKIHNIRSSLPEPEIEMIYTVYKGRRLEAAEHTFYILS